MTIIPSYSALFSSENRRSIIWLFLLVLLIGVPSLVFPFGRDQGTYAYTAYRMLCGDVAYSEVYAFKPPGTIVMHWLSQILFGHSMFSIRILDLLWTVLTALVLYLYALELFGNRWPALFGAALFARMYYRMGYWHTAQTDAWTILPTSISMLLAVSLWNDTHPRSLRTERLITGVAAALVGLSFLFKYTLGIFLAVLAISELIRACSSIKRAAQSLFVVGVGFLVPILIALLALYYSGALEAFWQIQTENVAGYTISGRGTALWKRAFSYLAILANLISIGIPLTVLGLSVMYRRLLLREPRARTEHSQKTPLVILSGWLLCGLVSAYVQGKFFVYHFIPVFPTVALSTVAAVYYPGCYLTKRLRPMMKKALFVPLFVGILLIYPPQIRLLAETVSITVGQTKCWSYWISGRFEGFAMSVRDNLFLSAYLRKNSRPNDTVFIWGHEPMVNFLSERYTGSRFPYHHPIIAAWSPKAVKASFIREFKQHPPTLFVVTSHDRMPWSTGVDTDSLEMFKQANTLFEFVNHHYTLSARMGRHYVYRRDLMTLNFF